MRKLIILGLVILMLSSLGFAGDLENGGAKIDFNIDSNTIQTGDYYISSDIIAVDSTGYTFEKDYQFVDETICKQWAKNETHPQETIDKCENWDTQQTLDKIVLAKLEFKECIEGNWYRIYKHNSFTTDKSLIKRNGDKVEDIQCTNGRLQFEVDSFSSYTQEEIDALNASLNVYYSFDDTDATGSTHTDLSGNGNTGTRNNESIVANGIAGEYASFDGTNDYIQMPDTGGYVNTDVTIAYWIRMDGTDSAILEFDPRGEAAFRTRLDTNTQIMYFDSAGSVGAVDISHTNTTLQNNEWYHVAWVYNDTSFDVHFYLNGSKIHTGNFVADIDAKNNAYSALFCSADTSGCTNYKKGDMDEFATYNRMLSPEEIERLYTINYEGYNPFNYATEQNVTPTYLNTSYFGNPITIDDFTFSSTAYTLVNQFQFNTTSANTNLGALTAFNMDKLSGATTSTVSGKIIIDDTTIYDDTLRSVTKNAPGVSGFPPLFFNVSSGTHNLSIYMKTTGTGEVSIYNIDASLGIFETTASEEGRGNLTTVSNTFSSTSLVNVHNKTINKYVNASTFIAGTFSFSSSVDETAICQFRDGGNSPYMIVDIPAGETRSLAANYITTNETMSEVLNLSCKTIGGNSVSIEGSYIEADMKDNAQNTINNKHVTNTSTNYSNYVDISTGHTHFLETDFTVLNGTNFLVSGSASFDSQTGAQTTVFHFNITNSSNQEECYVEKERYSDGDIGNIFFYFVCDELTPGSTYNIDMGVDVDTAETIRLYDESFSLFENTNFDISVSNLPPFIEINDPHSNALASGNLTINWTASDVQGDTFVQNVTLSNGVIDYALATNLAYNVNNLTFDTTNYSDGSYTLNITICENATSEGYCVSDQINIIIQQPVITVTSFSYGECPVNSVPISILFFTITFILLFTSAVGIATKSPIIIFLSGAGLIMLSTYIFGCSAVFGYIIVGIGIGIILHAMFMKF